LTRLVLLIPIHILYTGSDLPKQQEHWARASSRPFLELCRTAAYQNGKELEIQTISKHRRSKRRQAPGFNWVLNTADVDLPAVNGTLLNSRSGMFVSPIGRNVSREERNDYAVRFGKQDSGKHGHGHARRVCRLNLTFQYCGQIVLIFSPSGWDKRTVSSFWRRKFWTTIHFGGQDL
jgi:hypothetical protein